MPDFTLNTFHKLLTTLKEQGYTFQTFSGFLKDSAQQVIILRHDVDARKMNSLQTARMEKELGITGTYYFRMVPQSYDEEVIKQIAGLGHEIGYHYEDLSRCAVRGLRYAARSKKSHDLHDLHDPAKRDFVASLLNLHDQVLPEEELVDVAIVSFRENLAKLRRVVPVETICMHGSPLSKYENRMLWEKHDYRDFGIIGEPYFDINFGEVLYLTDTGRRWDGDSVSIRDKAQGTPVHRSFSEGGGHRAQGEEPRVPRTAYRTPLPRFHSTFDIINAAKEEKLPDKIMITVHPQRWDNRPLPWTRELIWQNIKNIIKKNITNRQIRDH
ncbi:MAG: hypothetical protein WAW07_05405 [Bacteroidales bacterium]